MVKQLDVVTVGRSSVDLYGEQIGCRLEDVATFAKYLGGSPANTAIGAARLGEAMGEGAAALVLEDWERAQARGAVIYAEVLGYASTCDHHHLTSPDSRGQVRAMQQALRNARLEADSIDYINAHGTATKDGDATEIRSLHQVFGHSANRVQLSATKSMHGHLLGAAGAIESLACVLSLQQQCVPPTAHLDYIAADCQAEPGLEHVMKPNQSRPLQHALCNSFAFGGSNAVLLFKHAPKTPA